MKMINNSYRRAKKFFYKEELKNKVLSLVPDTNINELDELLYIIDFDHEKNRDPEIIVTSDADEFSSYLYKCNAYDYIDDSHRKKTSYYQTRISSVTKILDVECEYCKFLDGFISDDTPDFDQDIEHYILVRRVKKVLFWEKPEESFSETCSYLVIYKPQKKGE